MGALSDGGARGILRGHRGGSRRPPVRDRHRRSPERLHLRHRHPHGLRRRHRLVLRADHRRGAHHRPSGCGGLGDARVALLLRPLLPRHGAVRARRHREHPGRAQARLPGRPAAAARAFVPARVVAGRAPGLRDHRARRDGLRAGQRARAGHDAAQAPRRSAGRGDEALVDRRRDHRRARPLLTDHRLERDRAQVAGRARGAAAARRAAPGRPVTTVTAPTPALRLTGVCKSFGRSSILKDVNLPVAAGERHAIIGPNGAGKATLFNLASARFPLSSGRVELKGEDVSGLPPLEINRRGLSRSFQITNIFPNLTVFDNVRCGVLWSLGYKYSFWHRLDGLRDARARAETVIGQIGLARRRNTPASALSYAEQRALEIGITIAGGADVILLDEPTSGMSRSESADAVALIRRVTEGKTLVMVEHDMGVVFGLADRISVLVYGQILATGTPAEIRANSAVQEAYLGKSLNHA